MLSVHEVCRTDGRLRQLKHIASYDCSAQNVIQESLEAAKDRVLA